MAPEEKATAARMLWSAATGMEVTVRFRTLRVSTLEFSGLSASPFREVRLASGQFGGSFKAYVPITPR